MHDTRQTAESFRSQRALTMRRARDARDWMAGYAGSGDDAVTLLLLGIKDLKQINDR